MLHQNKAPPFGWCFLFWWRLRDSNPFQCKMPVASCGHQFKNRWQPYDLPRQIGSRVLYRPPNIRNPSFFPIGEWVRIFCGHPRFCGCLFSFYRSGPFSRAAPAFVPAFSAIRASILWKGESTESDTAKHGGLTTAFLQQGQRRTLQAIGN